MSGVYLWVYFGLGVVVFGLVPSGIGVFERYIVARPQQLQLALLGHQAALEKLGSLVVLVLDFAFLGLVLTCLVPNLKKEIQSI